MKSHFSKKSLFVFLLMRKNPSVQNPMRFRTLVPTSRSLLKSPVRPRRGEVCFSGVKWPWDSIFGSLERSWWILKV